MYSKDLLKKIYLKKISVTFNSVPFFFNIFELWFVLSVRVR